MLAGRLRRRRDNRPPETAALTVLVGGAEEGDAALLERALVEVARTPRVRLATLGEPQPGTVEAAASHGVEVGRAAPGVPFVRLSRVPLAEGHGAPGIRPDDLSCIGELVARVDPGGRLRFACNLCGAGAEATLAELGRERPTCPRCRSTGRQRAVARTLERRFLDPGEHVASCSRRPLAGIGMSDMPALARPLTRAFAYTNTFLHQEPFLALAGQPAGARRSVDFVVCSEVLEHVDPPVERAVAALHRLLRRGGLLVLTTPYGFEPATAEHFPELHEHRIARGARGPVLHNRTRAGVEQTFTDLVFHGGEGATLELRVFARDHLVGLLLDAGFRDVSVEPPSFACGAWWPEPWSRVITAHA